MVFKSDDHSGFCELDADRPGFLLGQRSGSRIRLLYGSNAVPPAPPPPENRRRGLRMPPRQTQWSEAARLRTGVAVRVEDIGRHGVLIAVPARLQLGQVVEITLSTRDVKTRLVLTGVVRRCLVVSLSPVNYRGALEFDREIDLLSLEPFLASEPVGASTNR
jgi:hypothetical protein